MQRMVRLRISVLLVALAILLFPGQVVAQDLPVVYAVLLYSPYCSHCHNVIENHLPGIQEEFGASLEILFINVVTEEGQVLARSAYATYAIPPEGRVVPMMIIGDTILTGSLEIPEQLPGIVRDGLANGGIPLPDFPGMHESYQAYLDYLQTAQAEAEATAAATPDDEASNVAVLPDTAPAPTLSERLLADPVANGLAILILVGLIVNSVLVLSYGWRSLTNSTLFHQMTGGAGRLATFLTAMVGLAVALTLTTQVAHDPLATLAAWLILGMLSLTAIAVISSLGLSNRLVPLVALTGLVAAIYLTHVELTQTEAVCGAVGNCNVVQQSAYARLFGRVPVGVVGVIGYVAMVLIWILSCVQNRSLANAARISLLLLALSGTVFSIYLTFLKPFVIGATCAWCLTSALTMILLLWLAAPDGWKAIRETLDRPSVTARSA